MSVVINGTTGITTPGLDASGTNKFATTIGVGNATPAASGAGITFPATQSASSDANTLDDYEEGTWTPVLGSTGTASTYSSVNAVGLYTKVGRVVQFSLWINVVSGYSAGTGDLLLTGLPFTVNSSTGGYVITNGWYNGGVTGLGSTQTYPIQYTLVNSTTIRLLVGSSGTGTWGVSSLAVNNITNGFELRTWGVYTVA